MHAQSAFNPLWWIKKGYETTIRIKRYVVYVIIAVMSKFAIKDLVVPLMSFSSFFVL